jgi:hypothetical protein
MSRNDPRMQRGLAVARRMQEVGIAPGARRAHEAPDLERGMSELAWLGSRLTTADLQAITAADARGGLEGVRRLLASAGLTDAGFYALEAQYGRGGLGAVGTAVQAQIAHEAQATAEQDAVGALERLGPGEWQAVQASLAADPSGRQLHQRATSLGLNPQVAAVAVRHLAANGVEATRRAVAEGVQARAMADALHAAAERDLAAAQKDPRNPLAAPDLHRAALDLATHHAAALEAAGIGVKDGEGPTSWLSRIARTPGAAEKMAQAVGASPQDARTIVERTRLYEDHNALRAQLRDSDDKMKKARAIPMEGRQAFEAPKRKPDGIDAALRKAVETTGFRDPNEGKPIRAEGVMDAAVAMAAGREFKLTTAGRKHAARAVERRRAPTTGIDAAMGRAVRHLESGGSPEDARAAAEGTSTEVESTDTMNGGSTDAE